MNPTRRDVLKAGAGMAGVGALSGCLGLVGLGDEPIEADGYAAFFPLHDWAEAVGGEAMSFANPVSTGRMGHGWSPDADITPDVAETEIFFYLDTPEFSWAQDLADNLERDYDDIVTVDLLQGVEQFLLSPNQDHGDSGGDNDNSGEFHDPHTWVDPIIAQEMVSTIGDELAALDGENGDSYSENAAAYNERVQGVHEQFQTVVGDAELDIAVLAGHDSYQYIEHRYDFELATPTGVSPDARVSVEDIKRLAEIIDDNGIETILYDPFESAAPGEEYPQLVDRIFEESGVDEAEPLTPASGTTEQWAENGWGWVEQMEEVNIASLDAALNPA